MLNLEKMLSSSVHLGHQVKKWNPKMAPFIYGERNKLHIIDILQTLLCLQKACNFLYKSSKENKIFLFVSTKKQFSSLVESEIKNSNSFFVTKRWLGGMLTNWFTIKNCINNLKILSKEEELTNSFLGLTKKECSILKKRKSNVNLFIYFIYKYCCFFLFLRIKKISIKLEKFLSGIKDMNRLPDIVIIIGQNREMNAVRECLKLNISTVTIVDTNCDPTLTEFFIPANDDSVSSVTLILNELSKSINLI
uniref:Small ribosomal subunit protein uS2c n=1 Tax=Phacus pleuronectes TaxID=102908 RepID=A0A3G3LLV0_9EUGL|nr:ribosomal protein S2 [Phacus pleuronectes]AYQ93678.1 ribosomal protein S2 [Phacus pleuronectes]